MHVPTSPEMHERASRGLKRRVRGDTAIRRMVQIRRTQLAIVPDFLYKFLVHAGMAVTFTDNSSFGRFVALFHDTFEDLLR